MKLNKTLAVGIAAGLLALSMTGCSTVSASSANIAALVNSSSAYTVTGFDSVTSDTVSLIQEAADTYHSYAGYLENTDNLKSDLEDDGETASYIANQVSAAKQRNLQTKANFDESLASFNARGIGQAYAISTAEVPDLSNDEAVANYVATLLTGDAKVYVSDVISVPTLDDAQGTYTGNCTYMRYVYIDYAG